MKPLSKDNILWGAVSFCFVVGLLLAIRLNKWTLETWVPSLVCNLVTTGLAIYVINVVVADLDRREKDREAQRKRDLETLQEQRKEMRRDRRKVQRRSMMKLQVNWPVLSTLYLGQDLMKAADRGDLQGALAHIKDRQEAYREHADALGQMSLLYNRFMTFKELNHLEGLRRTVKGLAAEVDQADGDDEHKAAIMTFLEYLNVCSLTLGQAFVDQDLLKGQGDFNHWMGALKRKWDVPAIRKRLREQEHAKLEEPPSHPD